MTVLGPHRCFVSRVPDTPNVRGVTLINDDGRCVRYGVSVPERPAPAMLADQVQYLYRKTLQEWAS